MMAVRRKDPRGNRRDAPTGRETDVFSKNAKGSGQDRRGSYSVWKKRSMELIGRVGSKRLHVLGAIMHSTEGKTPSAIANYLINNGNFDIFDASNSFKLIKDMKRKGIVFEDSIGELQLTELGKDIAPNPKQFRELTKAMKKTREITREIEQRLLEMLKPKSEL